MQAGSLVKCGQAAFCTHGLTKVRTPLTSVPAPEARKSGFGAMLEPSLSWTAGTLTGAGLGTVVGGVVVGGTVVGGTVVGGAGGVVVDGVVSEDERVVVLVTGCVVVTRVTTRADSWCARGRAGTVVVVGAVVVGLRCVWATRTALGAMTAELARAGSAVAPRTVPTMADDSAPMTTERRGRSDRLRTERDWSSRVVVVECPCVCMGSSVGNSPHASPMRSPKLGQLSRPFTSAGSPRRPGMTRRRFRGG